MGLLAIDVGHTQTALGLYEGEELREHWRVTTERSGSGDDLGALYGNFVDLASVDGVAIASTVPQLHRAYEDFAKEYAKSELLELGAGVKTGVPVRYDEPLDELRRGLAGGRVRGRRARAGNRGLDGRALLAGRATVQGRLRRARDGDREENRVQPAVGAGLRLRRPGRRE